MLNSSANFENLRIQLEQASKIVLSSNVSKEQRTISENYFVEFHKSKNPYEFCRYLLETSKEPYILYQAVSTFQEAGLREWSLLPNESKIELQNFLLNYVVHKSSNDIGDSDKYVLRHILQTLAIFYKRNKLELKEVSETNMVKNIIEMFKTSNTKLKQMCLLLMSALLNEFSCTIKSTKLGIPSDSHFNAKRLFEQNELKILLMFVFETSYNMIESFKQNNISSIKYLDKDSKEMLVNLFSLTEQSFSWEFTSNKHILKNLIASQSNSIKTNNVCLEPTPDYKDFFLNQSLISLLFECYVLVRDDSEMAHAAMQPIIHLSTLNGPIFNANLNDENIARVTFFNNFLQCFLSTFTKLQINEYETFNLACLIENILSSHNIKKIHLINTQLVEALVQFLANFTMNCFQIEKASVNSMDDNKYLESYEKVLISWISIKDVLLMNDEISSNLDYYFNLIYKTYSKSLVEAYVKSRLSYVDTQKEYETIQMINNDDAESIEDENDSNEDDLHRHREILYSIGEFSKYSLDFVLPMLSNLLNERFTQLIEYLNHIIQTIQQTSSKQSNFDGDKIMTCLNEDIHWILLISGFVMFDINNDGEVSKIPKEIMNYSIQLSKYMNINIMNKLITLLSLNLSDSTKNNWLQIIDSRLTQQELCDPIVTTLFNAIQLGHLESCMFSMNILEYLSPQVASTLIWFFKELVRNYLFMKENSYEEISSTLQAVFGQDTNCGIQIVDFLLAKINTNFYIWSAENVTTSQTAKLLFEMIKHASISKFLLHNKNYWSISKIAIENQMPWILLPPGVKKLIIKSLIISFDETTKLNVFSTIINPLNERFNQLNSIKSNSIHTESTIKEVMNLIETFNGIVEGASNAIVKDLLPFVVARLQQGVHLLDIYHNYGEIVELILCMYNGVVEKFLIHLNDCQEIFHCFLQLVQVFSKHNSKKKSAEVNIEEDYYNDLLLFMTLLNTLSSTDLDLSQSASNNQISSIDIILVSLNFLVPLMNPEILKYQLLSVEYFKLISHITYKKEAKIFEQPIELFTTIISTLEFGINSGLGTEVIRLSLQSIENLCNKLFLLQLQHTEYGLCLRNIFKVVFELIYGASFEMELSDVYANVLYSMICCFKETFSILVAQLVEKYNTDSNIKQKLIEGFTNLTPSNFAFNSERRNRLKFCKSFNDFCVKTYGLLSIR